MRNYRVAVAGCGVMARTWVQYLTDRRDCTIISLMDVDPNATQRMAERFGLSCPRYTQVGQSIADRPDILCDLTVPSAHEGVTCAALEAGIDVFGEKPISDCFSSALRIAKTARRTGRWYGLMQNRRYLAPLRDMRAFLETGRLGKPQIVTADFFIGPHFGGFRDKMTHPLMVEMAIHTMDQCRLLTGAVPVDVFCREFRTKHSWFGGNCSAICTFSMSDGSVFSYRGCWSAEGCRTSWESQWRVVCEKGSMVWDGLGRPVAGVAGKRQDEIDFTYDDVSIDIPAVYRGREGHFGCLDAMFEAYGEGRRAETDWADNLYSVAMAFAAIKSAETQRTVRIVELFEAGREEDADAGQTQDGHIQL